MPKKKKTRKQKILSDMRHKAAGNTQSMQADRQITSEQITTSEVQAEHKPRLEQVQQNTSHTIATSSYQYLYSDLLKTFVLTFSIIFGELLLGYLFL